VATLGVKAFRAGTADPVEEREQIGVVEGIDGVGGNEGAGEGVASETPARVLRVVVNHVRV